MGQVGFVVGAVAAPGVLIKDEAGRAGEASSRVGVPDAGAVASNTVVVAVEVGGVGRAAALPGGSVEDEAGRASHTVAALGVPD